MSSNAFASTACEPGDYHWAGYNSAFNWDGVQGEIQVAGTYLPVGPANSHLIFYLANETATNNCYSGAGSDCQLQGGYGSGYVGGAQASNSQLYVEKNDVYGYQPLYYPGAAIGTSDTYRNEWTGETRVVGSQTVGHFITYFDNHTGHGFQNFGDAWLPGYLYSRLFAQAEAWHNVHGYCPVVNPYQYFGPSPYPAISTSLWGQGSGYSAWKTSDAALHHIAANGSTTFADTAYTMQAYGPSSVEVSQWYMYGG